MEYEHEDVKNFICPLELHSWVTFDSFINLKNVYLVLTLWQIDLVQQLAHVVCKGPGSKYFRLCGSQGSVATTGLCPCSVEGAVDNTRVRGMAAFQQDLPYGCWSLDFISLPLVTKSCSFEYFTCHKIILSSPTHLKMYKPFLTHVPSRYVCWARGFNPWSVVWRIKSEVSFLLGWSLCHKQNYDEVFSFLLKNSSNTPWLVSVPILDIESFKYRC